MNTHDLLSLAKDVDDAALEAEDYWLRDYGEPDGQQMLDLAEMRGFAKALRWVASQQSLEGFSRDYLLRNRLPLPGKLDPYQYFKLPEGILAHPPYDRDEDIEERFTES